MPQTPSGHLRSPEPRGKENSSQAGLLSETPIRKATPFKGRPAFCRPSIQGTNLLLQKL